MEQQIIDMLNQYQAQANELSTEIANDELALSQKRASLEQVRGAFAAVYKLGLDNGIITEETPAENTEGVNETDAVADQKETVE